MPIPAQNHPVRTFDLSIARQQVVDRFQELTRVVARAIRSKSAETVGLGIEPSDIARDMVLNGWSLATPHENSVDLNVRALEALSRLIARRSRIHASCFVVRTKCETGSTTVHRIDQSTTDELLEAFHYLGTARRAESCFGLFPVNAHLTPQNLLALATISDFDLLHLVPSVIKEQCIGSIRVLSRLLSFSGAPVNSLSRLMGLISKALVGKGISTLLTYNNPNLGFRGTIYRATNWKLIGLEDKKQDYQIDGAYLPRRELKRLYGTDDYHALKLALGSRIQLLPAAQLPLEIYALKI